MGVAGELDDLKEMENEDFDELVKDCGIPKLAAKRFKKDLIAIGAPLA